MLGILGAGGLLGRTLQQMSDCVTATHAQVDITSLDQLRAWIMQARPSHIINCAAYTHVDNAEKEPEKAYAINALGAENVGRAAAEAGARVIHISTDYVFSNGTKPFGEEDVCEPIGIYGMSKREGEKKLLAVLPSACIIRTSWLFGQGSNNFISSLLGKLRSQSELRVVADQVSNPTFCSDLAKAILTLLDHRGIFHFTNEGTFSRYQIAQDMLKSAQARGIPLACQSIIPVSANDFLTLAPRPQFSALSTHKYRLLIAPPRSWHTVLEEYLAHA